MITLWNEEWIVALLPPILFVASQAAHSLNNRYRTYSTTRCIAQLTALLTSHDEPQDEAIRGLRLRFSSNTILKASIFIAEHIYGNTLYRLTTIIEVCEIDRYLLRSLQRAQGGERTALLSKLSSLSNLSTIVGFAEEGINDARRNEHLYSTATLIASHPERAIRYIAKLKRPLSLYEVALLTQLMRRAGTPIAYTPLLISKNRNLQYIGIYICEQFAIIDAEGYLQQLVGSKDEEISYAALHALCSLHGDLTTIGTTSYIAQLSPPLRATFIRHAIQSCYSLNSCAHLLNSNERRNFSLRIESYKCRIICN